MRSVLLAVLLAVATSAAAQPGFSSVNFSYGFVGVAQGETESARLYVTGTWPITVPVTWKYTIPGYPEVSGTVYVEPGTKETEFPVVGPMTSTYVGLIEGTASITYTMGSEVTKTVPLYLHDRTMSIALSDAHVVESEDLQTLTFTISKPASMPLQVLFWGDDNSATSHDYEIVDREVVVPPGATGGEMHFRVPPDDVAEGDEAFTIQGELWETNTVLSIARSRVDIAEPAIDYAVTFGALKTLTLAPGQTVVVPVQVSPLPAQPIAFLVFAGNVVDVAPILAIGTDGKGSLAVTGKKLGATTIEIDSASRQRLAGLEVVVSPPRARSVRH